MQLLEKLLEVPAELSRQEKKGEKKMEAAQP